MAERLEFQFTHPGRGATAVDCRHSSGCRVSIHAPREGCDYDKRQSVLDVDKFQFTHPGRGATGTYY